MEKLSIFEKIKLLLWFIKSCHQKKLCIIVKDINYCPPTSPDSLFDFSLESIVNGSYSMNNLLRGLDSESKKTVFSYLEFRLSLNWESGNLISDSPRSLFSEKPGWKKEISAKYGIPEEYVLPEVFQSKMGLIFLPEKVKQYMKDKVFLDCGAFIGDSALAMLEFEPSKVLAFDMSPKNAREFMKTMERNQIPKSKAELIQCGVGDAETDISFEDGYDGSTSLYCSGNTKAHINTLDNLCENSGGIGFIKADVEGNGFKMVKGMTKILKRDRPVLSLAIYHNQEEFFEIKPFIESLQPDYTFLVRPNAGIYTGEIYLLAYPKELDV